MNMTFRNAGATAMVGVKKFLREEDGATAIEYALISGLMALICITALSGLGTTLSTFFTAIGSCLTGLTSATTTCTL